MTGSHHSMAPVTVAPDAVSSVAGKSGAVTLVKGDVGLGNVTNTSDVNKPVSTAQAAADALKVSKAGDTMTGPLVLPGYATGSLPDAEEAGVGAMVYDTTLSQLVLSDGTVWRDAAGTAI